MDRLAALRACGQSIWLDSLTRALVRGGRLARLVSEDGVSGVTTNPTIFQKAIHTDAAYATDLSVLRRSQPDPDRRYEALVIPDVQAACDILRPVFERTAGNDGYVSIDVAPRHAGDEETTVAEAHRLRKLVDRPNVLIKVPGTPAGERAFERLVEAGVNVNVTLLFSLHHIVRVFEAYVRGLNRRLAAGKDVREAKCVASLFLSRVDTAVDMALDRMDSDEARRLRGTAAVATARLAYQRYRDIFASAAFAPLLAAGARPQTPLWASTGTKDPVYSDVKYVEALIGHDTINTMPDAALAAFRDHGVAAETLEDGIRETEGQYVALEHLGIDLNRVGDALQREGVRTFFDSYAALITAVS